MPVKRATRTQHRRHEEAADWLLRQSGTALDPTEQAAFETWLEHDPENRRVYEVARRLMGEASAAIRSDPMLQASDRSPHSMAKPLLGCLLALAIAGAAFMLMDGPMRFRADAIAGVGELPVVTLADGSRVQLNASSAIAFDETDDHRTVRLLRGEALFEVARDPMRPFVVEVGDLRVTALGTAFDVRLGTDATDVVVTQHAVRIDFADDQHPSLRVTEGERAVIDERTGRSEIAESDTALALAWTRGQLVLDNTPLSQVVTEMNRHFSGRIVVLSQELAQRRVSGTMTISDTQAALNFVERALGVSTNRIGPVIVIRN
ncbi:FecR family protein [Ancylobacter sp. FA202]|uniref:FecR family protein n=1 Tax=Ancylobacter sp. FA202 TaxID=1111106 RepID=UPI00037A4422|nr:FecR family protein [Ancylobacter sp. FA202]